MIHFILTFAMGIAVGALLLIRAYESDKRKAPRLRCPEAAPKKAAAEEENTAEADDFSPTAKVCAESLSPQAAEETQAAQEPQLFSQEEKTDSYVEDNESTITNYNNETFPDNNSASEPVVTTSADANYQQADNDLNQPEPKATTEVSSAKTSDHPHGGLIAAARRAVADDNAAKQAAQQNYSAAVEARNPLEDDRGGAKQAAQQSYNETAEETEYSNNTADEQPTKQPLPEPQAAQQPLEIVTLFLKAPEKMHFHGYELLQSLLSFGLRYGKHNIFHRYHNIMANKKIMFSVAQINKPGSFDLERMGGRRFSGIAFFMSRNLGMFNIIVFEQMLQAAKSLQEELGGDLLSSAGVELTSQDLARLRAQLREVSSEDDVMPVSTDATGMQQNEQQS